MNTPYGYFLSFWEETLPFTPFGIFFGRNYEEYFEYALKGTPKGVFDQLPPPATYVIDSLLPVLGMVGMETMAAAREREREREGVNGLGN